MTPETPSAMPNGLPMIASPSSTITSAPGSSAAIWAASVRAGRSWPSPMLAVRIRMRLTGRTLTPGVISTWSRPLV